MRNTATLIRDAVLQRRKPSFNFPSDDIRRYIGAEPGGLTPGSDRIGHDLGLPAEHVLRETLTRALADTLWRHRGGNDVVNWLDAERFVDGLLDARSRTHRIARSKSRTPRTRNADARTQ